MSMRILVGFVLFCFVIVALMASTFFYRTITTQTAISTPTPIIESNIIFTRQPTIVMTHVPATVVLRPTNVPPTETEQQLTSQPISDNRIETIINDDEPIPFETAWEPTEQFELDTTGVITLGQAGIYRREYRVVTVDGIEIERELQREFVAQQPVAQINGYGTRIVVRTLETPDGELRYWRKVEMRVTSYTAATSGKARSDPWYGITASGWTAGYGVVAVDPSVVPWRTYVYVPGYGRGYVGDTGGGIIGRWIDLGYDENAFEWWSGYTDVYHLTPVPEPERINYLLPQELP